MSSSHLKAPVFVSEPDGSRAAKVKVKVKKTGADQVTVTSLITRGLTIARELLAMPIPRPGRSNCHKTKYFFWGFLCFYWCLLMFIDVYWCLSMFIVVYWCLLLFYDCVCEPGQFLPRAPCISPQAIKFQVTNINQPFRSACNPCSSARTRVIHALTKRKFTEKTM